MNEHALYPLRFDPIFQYRIWGGRGLGDFTGKALPDDGPFGEAWVMSDRDDLSSVVAEGTLKGVSLPDLMRNRHGDIMGSLSPIHPRFPLLMKFLDCCELLSVQVHPSDAQTDLLPPGEKGNTEAWLVIASEPDAVIYQGLKPGTTPEDFRAAIEDKTVQNFLPSFHPKAGDGIFLPAGTVHTMGGGLMIFEVQENSDVTFRLYDWDRVDAHSGKPRDLHIEQGLASTDFAQGVGKPVHPIEEPGERNKELLFHCSHFRVWRTTGTDHRLVGLADEPRVLVCLEGSGQVDHDGIEYSIGQGDVMLIPAVVGKCTCKPSGPMTLLEIAIPHE